MSLLITSAALVKDIKGMPEKVRLATMGTMSTVCPLQGPGKKRQRSTQEKNKVLTMMAGKKAC